MLLTFSYCFDDADINFTEIVERIMNDYNIKNYIYAIIIDNANANSTL